MKTIYIMPKPFAYLGLVASAVFLLFWMSAVILDGNWVFGQDSLSALGISQNSTAVVLFDAACIISGVTMVIFGLAKIFCERKLNNVSGLFMIVAGPFLVDVGIVNLSLGFSHYFVATTFAALIGISAILATLVDIRLKHYICALLEVALIATIIPITLTTSFPFFEAVDILAATVWVCIESVKMFHYGHICRMDLTRVG